MSDRTGAELTERFEDALVYATRVHASQKRKGTETPYISHLLAVAALVLESGGDEDEAIAALLHDAAEDQGGRARLDEIRRRFGDRVADIVEGCTDFGDPGRAYLERKQEYVRHLRDASPEVRRVALADKLHNARCILADYRTKRDALWDRFDGDKGEVLRYYRLLMEAFRDALPDRGLAQEFERVVAELEGLTSPDTLNP